MKKQLLSILMLFASIAVFGQTVIENPKSGFNSATGVKIRKIELLDTATVLHFNLSGYPGMGFMIPDMTFIQPLGDSKKLFIKGSVGVSINNWLSLDQSGEINYKLVFPGVGKDVKAIDYGEANDGGSWEIYDIQIRPSANSKMPKDFLGNWLNAETGKWEISLFDSLAVYKNKLWKYTLVNLNNGKGSIKMSSEGKAIELFVKADKPGTCLIGESDASLKSFTNDLSKAKADNNDKPYGVQIFNLDSATLCGYYNGFSPRVGNKTFEVYVNDIFTGDQPEFKGVLSSNGYFSVKLPVNNPGIVYISSEFYNGSAYLEPGKTLFLLLNPGTPDNAPLFMGEPASLNSDVSRIKGKSRPRYVNISERILDITPAEYKALLLNEVQVQNKWLDSLMQAKVIGAKTYQMLKTGNEYSAYSNLMEYRRVFESVYRQKYQIPREQRTLPIKMDTLKAEYYDFITNEIVNNPIAVISPSYGYLINDLKNLDILMSPQNLSTWDIYRELLKSGYDASEFEKGMFQKMKEIEESPEKKAYQEQIGGRLSKFMNKHMAEIQNYYKEKKGTDLVDIVKYLEEKGVAFTEDEKQLAKALTEYNNSDFAKKEKQFYAVYGDSLKRINSYMQKGSSQIQSRVRNANLEKVLGIKQGIATEILDVQEVCRGIVSEYSPLSDADLKRVQEQIINPFIRDYIALNNSQTKLKIEANKKKTGYVVNEVPKAEVGKLFESIMSKYKGKVVYVDFWATWCGPCRSAIEQIKPLKEDMAGEKVAFVYITGPTSPLGTWTNMITDIKGEHYRVSNEEWKALGTQFNIEGIPHVVLVGKNGEVINPHLNHMGNDVLKKELLNRINE